MYPEGAPEAARPVPTLHCVGWWDNLAIAHLRDVARFAATPGWAPLQYLWLDSIDHENYHIDEAGRVDAATDHDTDAAALEKMMDTYLGPALRFFDVFVKGEGSPGDIPRVQWHLAHDGYRTDASWPPPGAETTSLYLDALDEASGASAGALTATPPSAPSRATWGFDPTDPVPSPAESSWSYLLEYPDERDAAARPDVLVFDTAPLDRDLDLAGPASLWVRVASTAVTADVFARVLDVAPDGAAHLVIRGQAEFTAPDESTLRCVELGHTGYRLRAGHRLRLQLASSDFPEYPLNPGTGENRWLAAEILRAEHTLMTDAAAPARLEFTVLPGSRR
jgi:putative CocE/NonD family hydrolase